MISEARRSGSGRGASCRWWRRIQIRFAAIFSRGGSIRTGEL